MDHLEFSGDLERKVLAVTAAAKPKFRVLRTAALAAVLCMLMVTTAVAAGFWLERHVEVEPLGTYAQETNETSYMEFSLSESMDGITVHSMELNEDDYFLFNHGLLYSNESGFLRVREDYSLEKLESKTVQARLTKDGVEYAHDMNYVKTEDGIVSDQMFDYSIVDGMILVNLWHGNDRCWPVWIDIESGEWTDALEDFHNDDFEGSVRYAQLFRGGILLTCLAEEQSDVLYWVEQGSGEAVKVEVPDGAQSFVMEDELCYLAEDWKYFKTQGSWEFYPVADIPQTSDAMWNGLVTCVSGEETLQVYDLVNDTMYDIRDISAYDPWIQEDPQVDNERSGFNATRYSKDGSIVVVHSYDDMPNFKRVVDSIALLNTENGELKQLEIQSEHSVWTHGWLDDHRYGVITMDGEYRYLTVYEFDE